MSGSKIIRQVMLDTDTSVKAIAEALQQQPQTISNRLFRDTWRLDTFQKWLAAMGADVVIKVRSTGHTFPLE